MLIDEDFERKYRLNLVIEAPYLAVDESKVKIPKDLFDLI